MGSRLQLSVWIEGRSAGMRRERSEAVEKVLKKRADRAAFALIGKLPLGSAKQRPAFAPFAFYSVSTYGGNTPHAATIGRSATGHR